MDDHVWDPTTFTKNRERLLRGDIAERFFVGVLDQAREHELLSDEHFTVDGTLLEAAASLKSFKSKDHQDEPPPDDPGNPTVNFHGQKRSNETHQSTTDPDSMLCRKGKGKEAKLDFAGAISGDGRVTLGGDKNYDTHDFVKDLRELEVTPHVAQNNTNRRSAIDGRTTRHGGYQISQQKRKRIEEIFGWLKSVGLLRKLRHRGTARVNWIFIFATAAYNLVRMRKLVTV